MQMLGRKSMVFYTKKLTKKYQIKKKKIQENTRKYIHFLFKFHFETMVLSIGFVLN
jgi:hypothetical protein